MNKVINKLPKFPKIMHLELMEKPHKTALFKGSAEVTEKVDGYQFCMWNDKGKIRCKSKSTELYEDFLVMPKFHKAVEYINHCGANLPKNLYVFCEYLENSQMNVLKYDRAPKNNLLLLGAFNVSNKRWLNRKLLEKLAVKLDLEIVPILFRGHATMKKLNKLIHAKSFLGRSKVEGIVIKNYTHKYKGQTLWGKFVNEEFKEAHGEVWSKIKNGLDSTKLIEFCNAVVTKGRFTKFACNLRNENKLTVPALLSKVYNDVREEFPAEVKLFEEKELMLMVNKIGKKVIPEIV